MAQIQPPTETAPGSPWPAAAGEILLRAEGIKKYFPIQAGLLRRVVAQVRAVDGVDFAIRRGETLGVVGESGCGKTTLGRVIVRLYEPTDGSLRFWSKQLGNGDAAREVDLSELSGEELKLVRREIQMIFQDPFSSLDPRMTVGDTVAEPLIVHRLAKGRELREIVVRYLEAVGLNADHRQRYPHEFSGGQRQRIGIARALALSPDLIICDEPVSALDVSVQGQVLNLFKELQEQFDLTYVFIAHDLTVVAHISDRVAVMYLGRIVEVAEVGELFERPLHPYTEALLSAIPIPDPKRHSERMLLEGSVPSPIDPPTGCHFHPRCPYADEICKHEAPPLKPVNGREHVAACHFADQLGLKGMKGVI